MYGSPSEFIHSRYYRKTFVKFLHESLKNFRKLNILLEFLKNTSNEPCEQLLKCLILQKTAWRKNHLQNAIICPATASKCYVIEEIGRFAFFTDQILPILRHQLTTLEFGGGFLARLPPFSSSGDKSTDSRRTAVQQPCFLCATHSSQLVAKKNCIVVTNGGKS